MLTKINESEILVALGNRIRKFRLLKGLNQSQLSLSCDMEKSSLSKIESGKVNVSYLTLWRLGICLGIKLEELCRD